MQEHGQLITAQITFVPHSIGCKIKYSMKFVYGGKEYAKKVGCNFDETHKVGDNIQLKHLEGSGIFLFPTENLIKEFIAFATLTLFGVFLIIYGSRKK